MMVTAKPKINETEHRIATALGMRESAERQRDKAERGLRAVQADNARYRATVESVLALHKPETRYTAAGWEEVSFESRADAAEYGDTDNVQEFTVCHECGLIETHDGGEERCYEYSIWPCATVRAIESALGGGDDAEWRQDDE